MASLKTKGDLAELKVATDLVERGYRIAIPYGEDNDFDLILCRDDQLACWAAAEASCICGSARQGTVSTRGFAGPTTTALRSPGA
jgi:hypothetical protein